MAIKELTALKKHLFLCNGGSCKLNGAEETTIAIRDIISRLDISDEVHTTKTLCNGRCNDGPVVICQPEGIWFKKIFPNEVENVFGKFLVNQVIPEDKILFRYGDQTINTG